MRREVKRPATMIVSSFADEDEDRDEGELEVDKGGRWRIDVGPDCSRVMKEVDGLGYDCWSRKLSFGGVPPMSSRRVEVSSVDGVYGVRESKRWSVWLVPTVSGME